MNEISNYISLNNNNSVKNSSRVGINFFIALPKLIPELLATLRQELIRKQTFQAGI